MKKYGLSLVPLLLLVLIMGCSEEFYEFNLFAGMDPVTIVEVTDLQAMDQTSALEVLSDEMSSDSFIEQLSLPENVDQKNEILTYLGDIFMDDTGQALTVPETKEELDNYRDAAILYADINMATSGGDVFANNVFELLTTLQDTGGTDPDGTDPDTTEPFGEDQVRDMIASLLPADVDTPEDYSILISGLQNAIVGYEALGDTIGDDNGDAEITPDDAPDDIVLGEVAQNAICAVIVDIVIDVLDDPNDDSDDPVQEFFEWIEEGTSPEIDETVLQTKMEDIFGSTDPEDPNAPDPGDSEYDGINNLLLAAGLGTMLESFGGSSEESTDGTTK